MKQTTKIYNDEILNRKYIYTKTIVYIYDIWMHIHTYTYIFMHTHTLLKTRFNESGSKEHIWPADERLALGSIQLIHKSRK